MGKVFESVSYTHLRQPTQEMAIMAIGERIHFFRTLRGMTQKYLGMALGFPEKSADVRLAQYENGSRTPKADVTAALAEVLDVSPKALDVPDIDSYTCLLYTSVISTVSRVTSSGYADKVSS